MKSSLLAAFASLALAAAASAQAGGFTPGDLWESNDALAVQGAALIRIDPLTGITTAMHGSPFQNGFGGLAFDTYRHRLVWRASVPELPGQHTFLVDGAGQVSDTGITVQLQWFASAGDGRIFGIENTGGPRYASWIDAANRVHRLLDPTGTVPYSLPAGPFTNTRGLAWDAATNALYACSFMDCDNVQHQKIVMARLDLSVDGTRVLGPPTCASIDITSGFIEEPKGLSHLPDGNLLVACLAPDQVPAIPLASMLSFDPATMNFSTFALTGVKAPGDPYRVDDGVWSSALGSALILDTFTNTLRAFAPGSSGNGSKIVPTGPGVSGTGGSAEAEQITEISPAPCAGAWVPYSIGLKGKGGFVPTLIGAGCPVPGAALTLKIADVVGGAGGSLFVGLAPAAVPFKGGSFAVGALTLTAAIGVGGASGLAGAGTLDLPAALPANPLLTGLSVYMQGAFSDAAAVKGVSLTQGLQMEIG
jgi:hypothetical protein